jgi:hypothetical protein
MSFFPFIESIFYLSLGIIVILIFLIVFHFKQRIESLEKKGFLLTELYNNLVKEFSIMKTVVYSPPALQQKQNIVFSTEPSYNKIIVMDKLSEVDEESESESDSDSESDLDLDSESDSDSLEVVELEPSLDLEESIKVLKVDSEEESITVLKVDSEEESNTVLKVDSEPEPEVSTTNTIPYSDMKINELRAIVITKGLSTNPNKLKRAELLQLLEEETV